MATTKQKTIATILARLRDRHGDGMDYAKKRRLLDRQTLKNLQTVLTNPLARSVIRVEECTMKQPPFEADAFAAWLIEHDACKEARAWASGKSLPEIWETCERGDWLEWLLYACDYTWTAQARAEYEHVKATARAKYDRVAATALAEYDRVAATARAKYDRVAAIAWAEYVRVKATAWAEYERVTATARAEYVRVKADTIRTLLPYPFSAISH